MSVDLQPMGLQYFIKEYELHLTILQLPDSRYLTRVEEVRASIMGGTGYPSGISKNLASSIRELCLHLSNTTVQITSKSHRFMKMNTGDIYITDENLKELCDNFLINEVMKA